MTTMTREVNEICQRKSTRYMKIPLKSREQVYLVFLVPTIISCLVYVLHFAADLVVALQHYRENNPAWACITVGFMYAPAVAYFVLTISRPDWWMTDDDKLHKGAFLWCLMQIAKLVAFPFFALYRFAGLIVLSVDALQLKGEERKKTLDIAAAPAAIELYFFLQAWFQAAPQAFFQMHLLLRERNTPRSAQSEVIHGLCILVSICVIAIKTTSFQRYESQRVAGRKVPWAMWLKKYRLQELQSLEKKQLLSSSVTTPQKESAEPILQEEISNQDNPNYTYTIQRQNSVTPPLPPKNVKIIPPPAPLRGITSITPLPIPDMPAPPRPDSMVDSKDITFVRVEEPWKENLIMYQTLGDKTEVTFEKINSIKRKNYSKGLDEDDPVGSFLSFLWWFLFILARILSVAIFFEFYPLYAVGVIGAHYIFMITYLFYYSKYFDVTSFFINLWLGLVYIFSLIEYRVKFTKADKLVAFYHVFVILQNTLMTICWYLYSEFEGFWYSYSFNLIFICMSLCLFSMIVYTFLLKPEKRRVYIAQI
ncbi:uncharacterized protein LOC106636260 [Copidosoma floridanum]|uniref:uncharacterized protein LOC106636260 n=1 Tax=Copidosoma floridanum TaxID=29053 RepID=UPI0006C957DD|nr:uncharacterized protein LOC106636260 [Copidosoma floridanum]